jgi:hypothetical protein
LAIVSVWRARGLMYWSVFPASEEEWEDERGGRAVVSSSRDL